MKHEMNEQELEPDPLVGAALRWTDGEVPLDDVDWAAMRTNIRNRAALPLARRRALRAASPRWVRPLIPIAVAASIAVLLWTGDFGAGDPTVANIAPVTVGATLQPTIQEALLADVSEQEFRLLVADNDSDALLLIAASR
jgi:hypothetical protein